jgi:hypothetical protein
MKARLCFAAVACLAVAFAQDTPAPQSPSPQSAPAAQSQPDTQQAGKDNKTTMAGKGAPAEMKTQTYKGVLVDLSCAGGAGSQPSTASNATGNSATTASAGAQTPTGATNTAENTADRAAGNAGTQTNTAEKAGSAGGSCPVSANSTQLGLKMQDGHTVRFDMVGNQRAQDYLKSNKKWSEAASSGKEIHAKISGAMSGEKLIVSSIH